MKSYLRQDSTSDAALEAEPDGCRVLAQVG